MANLVRTLATVRTQRPYFITPGCVGNWRFDEGTGTLVRDSSGYRDNGTIHGATWTTGKFGKALQFDGVDDYVEVPDSDSLNITDAITIEAWVYDPPLEESKEETLRTFSNLEELKIKQIQPDKFAFKSLSGDLIEIGEERHSPPQPYLKLNKWDGEVSLKVNVPYGKDSVKALKQNKLKYVNHKYNVEFYPKEPEKIIEKIQGKQHIFKINEEGGVEFDVVLKEKPQTNVLRFPIQTEGLKFYYQPPLHPDHPTWADTNGDGIADSFRPENVVGSYAVYHESKAGDYSKMGGKNYRVGKAFHIYRPKIIDANGNWTWGDLKIKDGVLTIAIDQTWLDNAVYPVKVDPTFGYTSRGGSHWFSNDDGAVYSGSKFNLPETGTLESMTFWAAAYGGGASAIRFAVYNTSFNLIEQTGSGEIPAANQNPAEYTLNLNTNPTVDSADYWLMWAGQDSGGGYYVYYDTGSAGQGQPVTCCAANDYATNGFPSTYPNGTTNTNKYSIYCTYTPKTIVGKGKDAYQIQIDDNLNVTGYINSQAVTTQITKAWHHIALTYDGSEQRLYVDGVLKDNKSLSGSINTNANNLTIGQNVNGTIDEVRIYNRALSAEEIKAHFNFFRLLKVR